MSHPSPTPAAAGELADRPLPRLLYFLETRGITGRIELEQAGGMTSVLLRDGWPAHVDTPQPIDTLGEVLLAEGIVTPEQFNESLFRLAQEEGRRHGAVLREMGAIDLGGLRQGLAAQLRRKLHATFALREGGFRVYLHDHEWGRGESEGVRVDPYAAIARGLREVYDEARLRADLEPIWNLRLRISRAFLERAARFAFTPEEIRAAGMYLDGFLSPAEFAEQSGLGAHASAALVYAVWVADLFEGQPPVTRAVRRLTPEGGQQAGAASAARRTTAPLGSRGGAAAPAPPAAGPVPRGGPGMTPRRGTPERVESTDAAEPPAPGAARAAPPGPAGERRPSPAGGKTAPSVAAAGAAARERRLSPAGGRTAPSVAAAGVAPRERRLSPAAAAPGRDGGGVPGREADAQAFRDKVQARHAALAGADHFQVLGVERNAGRADVRKGYLALAREFHPDRCAAPGLEDLRQRVQEIFERVNEAHDVLSDDTRRPGYRESLQAGVPAAAASEASAAASVQRLMEAELNFQKGQVFLRRQDYQAAEQHLRLAVDMNPTEGEHVALLGWAMFCNPARDPQRSRSEVRQLLLQACEMSPQSARCFYYLGCVLKASGETEQALGSFRTALSLKPGYLEAEREVRVLTMRQDKDKRKPLTSTLIQKLKKKS